MIKVLQSRKDIGLVNPSSNNIGQHPGANDTIDGYAAGLKKMSGQFVEMGACIGFCMLFTRDLFDAVGYLDEVYKEGNFDDTDYSRRVEKAGFLCVRAKAAYVYHHIKSSFGKIKSYEESFKRNQEVYNKRWGRPKRLLYVVTKSHGRLFDWMQQDIFKKARSGNWIWLYFKKGDMQDVMNEHSNMKLFTLPEFLFELNCITRILTKKKRFDSIFVDDPRLIERIKKLERFHKADTTLMGG